MCGIFGGVSTAGLTNKTIQTMGNLAAQRGRDSSGFITYLNEEYLVVRSDFDIKQTLKKHPVQEAKFFVGHSRLITHGHSDNQPVERDGIFAIHNGIVLNYEALWKEINKSPHQEIDTEIIPALASYLLDNGVALEDIASLVLQRCKGVVAAALIFPMYGKLMVFSNNGSMYLGSSNDEKYFASERWPLVQLGCRDIRQVFDAEIFDIPKAFTRPHEISMTRLRNSLVPALNESRTNAELLDYDEFELIRCAKCILPSTMPYIEFDADGICNYCLNYKPRNQPKPVHELESLLETYRKNGQIDCIFPFSGGRDSSFGLHLAVKRFGLKPIAYTYDWGMVTDLGRRNISRMCGELGVENIIVAADIEWKRNNIRKNLEAWLKSPNLGMLSILTAGDKHFFRHIERIKKQTGISLNIWSVNPLEVTHFKAGFLGVPPDFDSKRVYQSGLQKQIEYQSLRFSAMLKSPGYFNASLFDTLSGEYYRSRKTKSDYYHLFDYWRWDEMEIEDTLDSYGWERAIDTSTTWRIGDGTAAFYNYVYHRVAGFSEHDTFRSNQVREGDISRDQALMLAQKENLPRYENIKWYLDVLGLSFEETIKTVNSIPRLM